MVGPQVLPALAERALANAEAFQRGGGLARSAADVAHEAGWIVGDLARYSELEGGRHGELYVATHLLATSTGRWTAAQVQHDTLRDRAWCKVVVALIHLVREIVQRETFADADRSRRA